MKGVFLLGLSFIITDWSKIEKWNPKIEDKDISNDLSAKTKTK